MRTFTIAAMIAAALSGTPALAQDAYYWSPLPSAANGARQMYVPVGTPIALTTRTQVSTKDSKPGDRFYLEVAESISFRGQIIVPVGSVAVGEVARADRNGHFGKKGKIDIRLLYVQTPWGPVRLDGRQAKAGKSGAIASFTTIALVSTLGFLIHGTSATIPFGTKVDAYLAEPLLFTSTPQQAIAAIAGVQPASIQPEVRSPLDSIQTSAEARR